jgi:hypothetical protein
MRRVLLVGLCGLLGCKGAAPEQGPSPDAGPAVIAPALAPDTRFLDDLAGRVVQQIAESETTKDVTCWTSFRQLDSFISSGQYSNFAVLAKIDAVKALVRGAWEKASAVSRGAAITGDELRAAVKVEATLPEGRQRELASFATDLGMKAYKDYRTTSEHWRIVLSVLEDEIDAGATNLRPLAPDALDALAELATRLSLRVLEGAGTLARDERSPMIESAHVKRAYTELTKELGLTNSPPAPRPLALDDAVARIGPLTKALVEAKIKALQTYNKDTRDLTTDLNRVSKVPLAPEALEVWMKDLQSFTHFVAGGYEPMQADNFLFDGNFAPSSMPRVPYVDAARAENATLQLFPHVIMPDGDVKLRFEPNPASPADHPRKAYDELMLDFRQNAVRDTAIHWIVMRNVYAEKPFAMDPFAAEYLSEVLSMMVTHYVVRGEALAKARGAKTIDVAIAKAVRDPDYVMVMPVSQEAKGWTPEQWKAKAAVLAKYPGALFAEVTRDSGLPTTAPKLPYSPTDDSGQFDIQRAMGAGIAVGDIDRDGYPDVFLAGEGMGRLYRNRGKEAPGRFEDVTETWGIPAGLDDGTGPLLFDQDGDGDLDLLVLRSAHPALLLRQDAPGHFTDVADALGFRPHRGAQVASVFDYDGDGDLDVYVAYYGSDASNRQGSTKRNLPSMDGRNGSPHELWRLGPDGRYAEVGGAAGVADTGWTLATSTFDYDNDGDADLFLANDFGADTFYRNKGDGTFEDVSQVTQTADRGSGMNVSTTDVNGDGWLDFYVSNIDMFSKNIKVVFPTDTSTINNMDVALQRSFQYLSGNKLWLNPADPAGHKPFLADQGARFEPGDRGWGWAAVFFDYENDGDEDMYLSTGWLEGSFAADQKKQMFLLDRGVFYLADPKSPEAIASNGRSAVAFDMDRDGDLDLLVNDFREPPALFANRQAAGNHWVALRLHGADRNTGAVGARVRVEAGGQSMIREVSCGNGYLGQNDEVVYVGVGKAAEASVTVRWPRGKSQTVEHVSVDRVTEVKEGA